MNLKITRFNYWVIVVLERGTFAERGVTNIEQVQTRGRRGSDFGHFVRT